MDITNISDKCLLVILDGHGENPKGIKNAISNAKTPTLDYLKSNYPSTFIEPGGESVGLPSGIAGNSEVGHMNLGAGRPVRQDLVRINEAIKKDSFGELINFKNLLNEASKKNRIHLLILLSDGGVHSHIDHLLYVNQKIKKSHPNMEVIIHAFMDGRDTAKNVGEKYLNLLAEKNIKIGSIQGRSIGMDRDRRWEKIKHCYDTLIGNGKKTSLSPVEYLKSEYECERFDEFIDPVLFKDDYKVKNNDTVFFLNFRPDRAIQLSLCLNDPNFSEFNVPVKPGHFLCMTPYIAEEVELPILFDKEKIHRPLSQHLSELGLRQLKIAETEKYAHVTYFFNGGEKKPFSGEEFVLIPSPSHVATYDQAPEMSAVEVTDRLITEINDNKYDFITVNYANCDMVGHTGNYEAAIRAVETVDSCLNRLINEIDLNEYSIIITADHGNCDQMEYEDGLPHTSHTKAKVPFILVHSNLKNVDSLRPNDPHASLKDVAPTVLKLMGLKGPDEFSGESIF